MKRLICLIFAVIISLSMVTVSFAEDAETLPIPERPEDFYLIDYSGLLDKRTSDAILEKGDALFAVTGAQVVFIVVGEDDKTDLGELAQQTLEFWELGSYERDNAIVVTMSFDRGRVSYAVSEGLLELYPDSEMQALITSHHVGDYFAEKQYDRAVLAMYNDIYLKIQEYYDIDVSYWDKTTYVYEAKYDHEFDYMTLVPPAGAVVILIIFIANAIRHNKKMEEIEGEVGDEAAEDFADITEGEASEETAENDDPADSEESEGGYNTDEGEYNTDEGEYNTSAEIENGGEGQWKYN